MFSDDNEPDRLSISPVVEKVILKKLTRSMKWLTKMAGKILQNLMFFPSSPVLLVNKTTY